MNQAVFLPDFHDGQARKLGRISLSPVDRFTVGLEIADLHPDRLPVSVVKTAAIDLHDALRTVRDRGLRLLEKKCGVLLVPVPRSRVQRGLLIDQCLLAPRRRRGEDRQPPAQLRVTPDFFAHASPGQVFLVDAPAWPAQRVFPA